VLAGDIAAEVVARSFRHHRDDPPTVRRELHVSMGEGRIDVATINGLIRGYEIKSASDGLGRLARQVRLYDRVVDEAVLVVERRHPSRLLERLPDWWGLWAARDDDGQCLLEELRPPQPNPKTSPLATAQLLWRAEALTLLRDVGHGHGLARANRWQLWTTIVEVVPLPDLRRRVCETIRARRGW